MWLLIHIIICLILHFKDNNAAHQILRESMARSGLPRPVIEYLKMCMILEPMMKIMERSTMESIV